MSAQGDTERRYAYLPADEYECATVESLPPVADERRTEERRHVGRRHKETDRNHHQVKIFEHSRSTGKRLKPKGQKKIKQLKH